MSQTTHLLYLHGFRSSPQSFKARLVERWLRENHPAVHWWCPQLPASPQAALALIDAGIAAWPVATMAAVGSSLGGYYATVLAERIGCKAALLNPAIEPARDLAAQLGEHPGFHDPTQRIVVTAADIDAWRALRPPAITQPQRYFAIIAKGDEVLDWREMVARYPGCRLTLLEGSDHGLTDFEAHLPALARFLDLH